MLPWTPLDPLKEKAPASGETGASSVLGVVPGMEHVIGGTITRAIYRGRRIISNWIFLMR